MILPDIDDPKYGERIDAESLAYEESRKQAHSAEKNQYPSSS
jgi:hypothetical protein